MHLSLGAVTLRATGVGLRCKNSLKNSLKNIPMYATIFHWLSQLSVWLERTQMNHEIQVHDWIVPIVQSIHILGIAVVASSALMINLRLLGLYAADQPLKEVLARFLPFIWWPLIVLLLTGIVMIVGEPPLSLKNPVFQIKMTLLFAALVVTVVCQVTLRRHPDFGDLTAGRRAGAATLASVSMLLWVGIIFAGRWIAYYYSCPDSEVRTPLAAPSDANFGQRGRANL